MPGIEIKGRSKIANYRHGGRAAFKHGLQVKKEGVGRALRGIKRIRGKDSKTHGRDVPTMAAKGGRIGKFGGGRTNLLEQLGRVEAEPSNPNRRAEISRVHGELNRGYAKGGRAGFEHGGQAETKALGGFRKVSKNQKKFKKALLDKKKKKAKGGRAGFAHGEQAETWDKRKEGVGAAKRKPKRGFKKALLDKKKKKYTKEQQAMHRSIEEKKAKYRNRPQGKTFDASPIQLAKAGMTESKRYGLPAHSKTFKNSKLTEVKPYGGTIDTGFKGYDKSTPGVGLKSGGRTGFKKGTDRKWIQKAVNPKHKGYCTPMTKKTCTPARKALARTFKKKAKTGWS